MIRIFIVFIFGIFSMTLLSCVKDSEIDLPDAEDVMTLNLILSPEEKPLAVLTNSVALTSLKSIADILNAHMVIYADDEYLGTFSQEEFSDFSGLPRMGYRLTRPIPSQAGEYVVWVSAPGYPDIEAVTQTIERTSREETIRLDSISLNGESVEFQSQHVHFTLGFKDVDPAPNYYHIIVYEEAKRKDQDTNEWVPLRFKNPIYFFLNDLKLEDEIVNNDRNGYFLYGTIGGILVNDELFNSDFYTIQAEAVLSPTGFLGEDGELIEHQVREKMYAEVRTVNEDYYKYYRSIALQRENSDNPFAEPVIIHSNVESGLGAMTYFVPTVTDTIYFEY